MTSRLFFVICALSAQSCAPSLQGGGDSAPGRVVLSAEEVAFLRRQIKKCTSKIRRCRVQAESEIQRVRVEAQRVSASMNAALVAC